MKLTQKREEIRGGGVATYIRNDIASFEIHENKLLKTYQLKQSGVKLSLNMREYLLVVFIGLHPPVEKLHSQLTK